MSSNAERGARAKARTKKWLEAQGYQVVDLEKVYWIFTPKGRLPMKKDQMGADLLGVLPNRNVLIQVSPPGILAALFGLRSNSVLFVQVKSGKAAIGGTFPAARREFAKFSFPACTTQVVIAWPPRARHPRIVVM